MPETLDFLFENAPANGQTLETGCGLSTLLFADKSARHVVISPAREEFEGVLRLCREHGIKTGGLDFQEGTSEHVLPGLETGLLDLVLIDGRHGFPAPFIDWFYTASKLKVGGLMVVDDIWLWTGEVLYQFMLEQPEWELVWRYSHRTAAFRKLADGSEDLEWTSQNYVNRMGQLRRVGDEYKFTPPASQTLLERLATHASRGEWRVLARKLLRRLNPSR
jgi:predicted O-methyltransferase YrrM